ncbi:MAG: hypothetical protein Q4E61_04120, partial [Alphaproteobacteria bacterium]|nr:hypothetical protein [Alphaproteobacteria bacterium]
MQTKFNKIANPIIAITSIMAIIIMIIVSCKTYGANCNNLIGFIAFFIINVVYAGFAVLEMFYIKFEHFSTKIATSLFTGWSLNILFYFLGALTKLMLLPYFAILIIYIAYI